MGALAVKEKLASGSREKLIRHRVIAVAHLAADLYQESSAANDELASGAYYDAETGLHYNWHRYYDPKTGRYVTSDPIGLAGGLNTYSYVGSNPLVRADFTGLDYWIEGPVQGEGGLGFHQSICVGQYNSASNRKCISFGVEDEKTCDGTKCKGKVYPDDSAAGPIAFGRYRRTTPEQDRQISAFFDELLGRYGDYDLIKNNCRDFVYRVFRSLEYRFGGS